MPAARIVFATVGSLGDLFPFLAVGKELRRRGHHVTVATHAMHQSAIELAGLTFANASGIVEPEDREAFTARAFHPWRGPHFVVHDMAALDVRESYHKLLPLCADADVMITSTLAFAAQIIAEQASSAGRLRWLSAVLAPAGFISASDPPATGWHMLDTFLRGSASRGRWLSRMAERITRSWTAPVRALRNDLALPPQSPQGDPFHRGQHAPDGVLALFSPLLGKPQPDWPPHVVVTGAARYQPPATPHPALQAFLDAGPAPLVFTLGSTAVHVNAQFLRESAEAAQMLGRRAVLLTGSPEMRARLPQSLPATLHCVDYAVHADLFARAAVVVHHGGIGTSTEALRSGHPMLVVPHGFDQPDNAARLRRLGVAHVLPARRYRADRAAKLLDELLQQPRFQHASERAAQAMQREDGAKVGANVVEASLLPRTGVT